MIGLPACLALALASLVSAQKLQITSPASGTVANPGQTLTVTVAASGGTFKGVAVIGENPIGMSEFLTSPPYQFTIPIPGAISPRTYSLTALGSLASGQLANSDPITIDVERADAPVRLDANLSKLTEAIGNTSYLRPSATFEDGRTLDVTESSLVTYSSDTPTVAAVDKVGRVTSAGSGSAHIVVTYGELSLTIPIVVEPLLKILPERSSLYVSQTEKFDAYFNPAPDSGTDVAWSLNPALGSIDAEGLYTAPASIASWQGVTVTATSLRDPTMSATAQIWLFPPVSVVLSPPSATLLAGQHLQLTVDKNNDGGAAVKWSIAPPGVGTFSPGLKALVFPYPVPVGNYTAPAPITAPQTVTIKVTSVHDNTKSSLARITLVPSVALSVNPATATLEAAASLQLKPTVNYSSNASVTWSVSANGGTITASGLYTAPADVTIPRSVNVTATSVDSAAAPNGAKTYTATVAITILPKRRATSR